MMKPFVLILALAMLAGCVADDGTTGSKVATTGASQASGAPTHATVQPTTAEPTADAGSLIVTVTDNELKPIEAVTVELSGADLVASTDAAGTATFNGLTPSSYTVLVAKPGYDPQLEKGKVVQVAAGETTEVTVLMEPVEVVNADNSYSFTWPFKAHISCGVEGMPGIVLNRVTPCGDWLTPGGQPIGDPNHKSRFKWKADSMEITGIVAQAKWQPTTGVTAQQLRLVVTHVLTCTQTSCIWNDATLNVGGPTPLRGEVLQAPDNKITKRWGEDPATYPRDVFLEVGAYCTTNCVGVQVVVQQGVDLWLTAFYGAEPPADFSALPK